MARLGVAADRNREAQIGMTDPTIIRRGWRAFRCTAGGADNPPICNNEWEEPTRDRFSPSGVDCPVCGGWTFPHANREDATLKVDDMGNLISA